MIRVNLLRCKIKEGRTVSFWNGLKDVSTKDQNPIVKRNKWSVTRFKTHQGGRSYGPAGKYRFETRLVARLFYFVCQIESLWCGHAPSLCYIPLYQIDTDIGIDFADAGPWRSYHLETTGDSFNEMVQNATVSEIDQDGGELDTYSIEQASSQIEMECLRMILDKVS